MTKIDLCVDETAASFITGTRTVSGLVNECNVSFIAAPFMEALSHRMPASPGMLRERCGAHDCG